MLAFVDVSTMRIAVIVPTLDEEEALRTHLHHALAFADEVVISDGGSRDRSVEEARRQGAIVVTGPPGRGPQLNRGAEATDAEALLFLHADTRLPPSAGTAVRRALETGAVGGGFQVRFDGEGRLLRLGTSLVNTRTRLLRAPLGDQAQFVTREAFQTLGGYRPWPILEDVDFIRRLRRLGPVAVLEEAATTSSRRFERQGALRTVIRNWAIFLLYLLGASPHHLARYYRKVR